MDNLISEHVTPSTALGASLVMNHNIVEVIKAPVYYADFTCYDKFGRIKWIDRFDPHNTVVTVGRNDLLDKYLKGSAYTAAWYLGLKGTGSVVAGDTLSSHSGWAEVNPYSGNRPAITFGTSTNGSNTANVVGYSINGSATVAGAFVANVNTGTAGLLYSAGDFSAGRSVLSGDTLNVTLTVSV